MKFCTNLLVFTFLLSLNAYAQTTPISSLMQQRFSDGTAAIIGKALDSGGTECLVISPNSNATAYERNLLVFTPSGALVIGEDHPCALVGTDGYDPALYLRRGDAFAHQDMWSIIPPDPSQARIVGEGIDNQSSMDALRQLSLIPTGENKVGININEVKEVELLSASVGAIEYDGERKQTFNGSQLFYHYLGEINNLDEQLEAEKTRNDDLEARVNELERILDRLTNPRPEAPTEDKKTTPQSSTLKVFPNPTRDNLQVEIDVKEKLENAEIHIMDTTGNLVLRQEINGNIPSINLNISDLNIQSGHYFCILISAGKAVDTQTITIVK